MPFAAACLVPPAPALLPELTGSHVPEVEPLRQAVREAVAWLLARSAAVVVATTAAPGSLDGFGRPVPLLREPSGSWTHDLGSLLCDRVMGAPYALRTEVLPLGVEQVESWLDVQDNRRAGGSTAPGLLVLADGSTTRGRRAPLGDDPRGSLVDEELRSALAAGRPPVLEDDVVTVTGCTGGPGVAVLAALAARTRQRCTVPYADAPLGVGYLVARWGTAP